jgi:hypothetical protein
MNRELRLGARGPASRLRRCYADAPAGVPRDTPAAPAGVPGLPSASKSRFLAGRGYRCDCVRLPEYRCDQIRLPHARQGRRNAGSSPSAVSLPAMALEMSASIFVLAGRPGLRIKRVNNFSGNFAIHL